MSAPVFAAVTPHPPIIVPAVGRGRERETQATLNAYARLRSELAASKPDVLLFICPHGPLHADEFLVLRGPLDGSLRKFGAHAVRFQREPDTGLVDRLLASAKSRGVRLSAVESWEPDDHSLWVPLAFLSEAAPDACLVAVAISYGSPREHYELGCVIAEVLSDWPERVAIIASADGSHALKEDGPYGYHPMAPIFEEEFQAAFTAWDREAILSTDEHLRAQAAEDSIPQVSILLGALSRWNARPEILASEAPWGVGYMTALVGVEATEEEDGEAARITGLARASVEGHLRDDPGGTADAVEPSGVLAERAGAFVSIHMLDGELRGCIGTVQPRTASLAEEIARNAVAASEDDPRFRPVRTDELDRLTYKVDVLEPPEAIADASALDPQEYGVIVEAGRRRGLLLPALEGIERVDDQIQIAREKAGIGRNEAVRLSRFRVRRYEEEHTEPGA
jgi:AmmeMemoRadiSam system protein A